MNRVQKLYWKLLSIGQGAICRGGTSPYHHREANQAMIMYGAKDFTEEEVSELERLLYGKRVPDSAQS